MKIVRTIALLSIATNCGVNAWTKSKPVVVKKNAPWNKRGPAVNIAAPASTRMMAQADASRFDAAERQKLFKAATSGLAVSLAMVPEAVAFAFVAG
ncbi:MAG: hypothetical protein SGBAC_013468, partial [Bacillariaceae sp.]